MPEKSCVMNTLLYVSAQINCSTASSIDLTSVVVDIILTQKVINNV